MMKGCDDFCDSDDAMMSTMRLWLLWWLRRWRWRWL